MSSYVIDKVSLKDPIVKVEISDDKAITIFNVLALDYFSLNLKEGQEINREQYENLKELHSYCFAYQKCLKKLGYKDLSEKEIDDLLNQQENLNSNQKDKIIETLKELGLINDEALVVNKIEIDQNKLIGKKKTKFELERRGLDKELVAQEIEKVSEADEIERCKRKANLLYKGIKQKSFRETIQGLRTKLSTNGFEGYVIDAALNELDFQMNQKEEKKNLEITIQKALKHYEKNLEGYKLKNKVYNYALAKGFNKDDITAILNELEVDNNED